MENIKLDYIQIISSVVGCNSGNGGNSDKIKVYNGRNLLDGKYVRIHQLDAIQHNNRLAIADKLREDSHIYNLLFPLNTTFIIKDPDYYWIIPNHSCVNMCKYVYKKEGLNPTIVSFYFKQICDIVEYCHKHNVIICDLHPHNIIFVETDVLSLENIHLMSIMDQCSLVNKYDYRFISPETISIRVYNKETDIWSLGVLLYFMLSSRLPFSSESNVITCTYDICIGVNNMNVEAFCLIKSILIRNPVKRPSIAQILNSAYMRILADDDYLSIPRLFS